MTVAAVKETPKKERQVYVAKRSEVILAESSNRVWRAILGEEIPMEDATNPHLLSVVCQDFVPLDTIFLYPKSLAWQVELLVLAAEPGHCQVVVRHSMKLPPVQQLARNLVPPGFSIVQDPASGRWSTWRLADGVCMGEGFDNFNAARHALVNHASLRQAR